MYKLLFSLEIQEYMWIVSFIENIFLSKTQETVLKSEKNWGESENLVVLKSQKLLLDLPESRK